MSLRDSLDSYLPFVDPSPDETDSLAGDCGCVPSVETPPARGTAHGEDESTTLTLDATDCPHGGDLTAPDCRATAVGALTTRDAESIRVRVDGLDRRYEGAGATLLLAAGRFAARAHVHDADIARLAHRRPHRAARRATGRAGPVARIAAESGLAECARRIAESDADTAFRPGVSPTVAGSWVRADPPPEAELADVRDLPTGGIARVYDTPRGTRYHLSPDWLDFDAATTAALAAAYRVLADGDVSSGDRAPGRAVRSVLERPATPDALPVGRLTAVLRRHTRGLGILEPLFADPRISDVYATAPVTEGSLRVVVDDAPMQTNVGLTGEGAAALASRFRRTSGRAFSRAAPTLDATVTPETDARDRVRVAGVTDPPSDGPAFAFRAHDSEAWTLPALVATGTLPADAAALVSVAVERAVSGLIAGTRGAGKTTTLSALLWELPAVTRTVVVEDTPELPVDTLQREGRDVQALRTTTDDGPSVSPTEALRTALRLGEGALVVGEVRGEEAAVLYEAMRVGAGGSTVLGTIHGDGGQDVRERVVADLGVPESSFAATDLLVTCSVGDDTGRTRREPGEQDNAGDTDEQLSGRHVARIEEVVRSDDGVGFAPLFTRGGDGHGGNGESGLSATGRVDRGNSRLVADLTNPDESYADLLDLLAARERLLSDLAETDRTRPSDVVTAYRDRRRT